MPIPRLEHVEVGSRVAYEDAANPRREGRVEAIEDTGICGTAFTVRWEDPLDGDPVVVSDLRQHGWAILADLPGSIFDGAEMIASYTRLDAIRDGAVVPSTDLTPDEPLFAKQAGWVAAVDLTAAVAQLVVPTERERDRYLQDTKGRLWDLLSMARMYGRSGQTEWLFPCIFQLAGPSRARWTARAAAKTLRLKVVLAGDEDGPVATIMFPEES